MLMLAQPAPPAPPMPNELASQLERLAELRQLQQIGQNEYTPATAQGTLAAARASRSELRSQLSRLEDRRDDLARDLNRDIQNNDGVLSTSRTGLEARIADVDARIKSLDEQLAQADQAVANAAAVPGAIVEPPPRTPDTFSETVTPVAIVFTLFVLFPLTITWSRRLWKRGATIVAPVPAAVTNTLEQMSAAVDAMALEVERIGEGQRFITRVMADDPRVLNAGAMPHVPVQREAQREEVRRDDQGDWR